ncbi:unnamed protein product, partial [Rotaria sp. Silwood1]
MVVNAALKRRR